MADELAKVRLEMSELKSQINILNTQGKERSNKLLYFGQQVPQGPQELYILGGLADVWLDSVVAFSSLSNELKSITPLLAPRAYAAASILHGYMYIFGGGDGTSWSDSGIYLHLQTFKFSVDSVVTRKKDKLAGLFRLC